MICKCRRILLFFSFFYFFLLFFSFFFYLPTKPEKKNRQKNPSLPKKKSCLSCDLMSVHLYRFFSLGMLWWTAVNLYSSCKLIVRKLYRFLYFGRKVFFLCNKRFPILASYPWRAVSLFTLVSAIMMLHQRQGLKVHCVVVLFLFFFLEESQYGVIIQTQIFISSTE